MLPPPYSSGDETSFAVKTVKERLPNIFNQIADDLEKIVASSKKGPEPKDEATRIVSQVRSMTQEFTNNAKLVPIKEIYPLDNVYNELLGELGPLHYQNAPWLFFECYAYRKVQQLFDESEFWKTYDMFGIQKDETFSKSEKAVGELAARFVALQSQILDIKQKPLADQLEVLEVLFHEIAMTSLWGNATDLSLLVTIDMDQIKKLQVASAERDKEAILANDFSQVWKQLRSSAGGRVDIVLDNSGFELYTDLIMALFLLETGLAEQVVLHPKNQPWFVSDVTPRDWLCTVNLLEDKDAFPSNRDSIERIIETIEKYQSTGQIVMRTSYYWTLPVPFWDIVEGGKHGGDEVWRDLRASKLVIFKGDLNYRKLTGDLAWPRDTPFTTAIQGLASNNIPMVTLRTCKADVVVGLAKGKGEELDAKWGQNHSPPSGWAWTGDYAVISYSK